MLEQFENQQYLNIETFRKSGEGVKTPVWFARDGEDIYVWTKASSGKARRIRRDRDVKVTPSTASGEPIGEWVNALATADASPEALKHINQLMQKKYGLAVAAFRLMGSFHKSSYTQIKIQLSSKTE